MRWENVQKGGLTWADRGGWERVANGWDSGRVLSSREKARQRVEQRGDSFGKREKAVGSGEEAKDGIGDGQKD